MLIVCARELENSQQWTNCKSAIKRFTRPSSTILARSSDFFQGARGAGNFGLKLGSYLVFVQNCPYHSFVGITFELNIGYKLGASLKGLNLLNDC